MKIAHQFICRYDEINFETNYEMDDPLTERVDPHDLILPIYTASGNRGSPVNSYTYQKFIIPVYIHGAPRGRDCVGVELPYTANYGVVPSGRWDRSIYRGCPIVPVSLQDGSHTILGLYFDSYTFVVIKHDSGTGALYSARVTTQAETVVLRAAAWKMVKGWVIDLTDRLGDEQCATEGGRHAQ